MEHHTVSLRQLSFLCHLYDAAKGDHLLVNAAINEYFEIILKPGTAQQCS